MTAHISLAPELRREVDFINFMDLEMSRGDKAITLLSGDGRGVIKPIASDDEEVVWKKKESLGDTRAESSGLVYQRDD